MARGNFRLDINGLRGWAVIAVVLFHFLPDTLPGGFSGVDVFFVISGFLMTGIIFSGIENRTFNIIEFYVARANRIIPPLAILCISVLFFGYVYLYPPELEMLGKHAVASLGFFSNILYWRESGYFDAASHEKWLLHTWSLSVEWQFYILYPLILAALGRFFSLTKIKWSLLLFTVGAFAFGCIVTFSWPDAAYFLLPTRAWELMLGGIAYAFPINLSPLYRRALEAAGLALIVLTYLLVDSSTPWPGYHALAPALGAYLLILANRQDSLLTNNATLQFIGKRSYSIYLWHWPVAVLGLQLSVAHWWVPGFALTLLLGWMSYRYVETIRLPSYHQLHKAALSRPALILLASGLFAFAVFRTDGVETRFPPMFNDLHEQAGLTSPHRSQCHISEYRPPEQSCEYFADSIRWATLGDSHTIELAYELAKQLQDKGEGLKHFSFSGCPPSFQLENGISECADWYDASLQYIVDHPSIENVVVGHRWSFAFWGDNIEAYPDLPPQPTSPAVTSMTESLDKIIRTLAGKKEKVFVIYPMPELGTSIQHLINQAMDDGMSLSEIPGITLDYYHSRNSWILHHFDTTEYPENVHFIQPEKLFCDSAFCYAVKGGRPLYYDDDHPSLAAAKILSREIISR
ncbi:acyltransferase family protein [Microbulbifer salipaludis]|uniref:Acyltransferase family protein n=1 Tax=Microbulbifer salipaludis TaxID=187980 RepID=A0ABS3E357_9GAMM|nr:acyltransferase family protein [Microbulbifer salipaludis]MBN8429743.1 acyltransferase family protein [Microbulbifer salipaludis]